MTVDAATTEPVGTLQEVLAALADPIRLAIVTRLASAGEPVACAALYENISKSTASHHFKVLREAGVTERVIIGGQTHQQLRLDEVEAHYPGVLSAIIATGSDAAGRRTPPPTAGRIQARADSAATRPEPEPAR